MDCVLWYAVSQKNWLLLGALNGNCGSARLIHVTGIEYKLTTLSLICVSIYICNEFKLHMLRQLITFYWIKNLKIQLLDYMFFTFLTCMPKITLIRHYLLFDPYSKLHFEYLINDMFSSDNSFIRIFLQKSMFRLYHVYLDR